MMKQRGWVLALVLCAFGQAWMAGGAAAQDAGACGHLERQAFQLRDRWEDAQGYLAKVRTLSTMKDSGPAIAKLGARLRIRGAGHARGIAADIERQYPDMLDRMVDGGCHDDMPQGVFTFSDRILQAMIKDGSLTWDGWADRWQWQP